MSNTSVVIRDYEGGDLGRVVKLWEERGLVPEGPDGLGVDEAADLMNSPDSEAVIAERKGEVVGVAVGPFRAAWGPYSGSSGMGRSKIDYSTNSKDGWLVAARASSSQSWAMRSCANV